MTSGRAAEQSVGRAERTAGGADAQSRALLVAADLPGLEALEPRKRDLGQRLQGCHQQRADLLKRAAAEGLPGDSIRSLSGRLPASSRRALARAWTKRPAACACCAIKA